jgi:hypothetical protein
LALIAAGVFKTSRAASVTGHHHHVARADFGGQPATLRAV